LTNPSVGIILIAEPNNAPPALLEFGNSILATHCGIHQDNSLRFYVRACSDKVEYQCFGDGGSMVLWKSGIPPHNYMASQARWPWLEIIHCFTVLCIPYKKNLCNRISCN
jgi:hypothetical protein